jgi:hypothetical protein
MTLTPQQKRQQTRAISKIERFLKGLEVRKHPHIRELRLEPIDTAGCIRIVVRLATHREALSYVHTFVSVINDPAMSTFIIGRLIGWLEGDVLPEGWNYWT